jgi:hypothetical protein
LISSPAGSRRRTEAAETTATVAIARRAVAPFPSVASLAVPAGARQAYTADPNSVRLPGVAARPAAVGPAPPVPQVTFAFLPYQVFRRLYSLYSNKALTCRQYLRNRARGQQNVLGPEYKLDHKHMTWIQRLDSLGLVWDFDSPEDLLGAEFLRFLDTFVTSRLKINGYSLPASAVPLVDGFNYDTLRWILAWPGNKSPATGKAKLRAEPFPVPLDAFSVDTLLTNSKFGVSASRPQHAKLAPKRPLVYLSEAPP